MVEAAFNTLQVGAPRVPARGGWGPKQASSRRRRAPVVAPRMIVERGGVGGGAGSSSVQNAPEPVGKAKQDQPQQRQSTTQHSAKHQSWTALDAGSSRIRAPGVVVEPNVSPGRVLVPVRSYPVPGMPNWRYAGPPLDESAPRALPAVVYFALTAEQSLELAPFNEFVRFVLAGGDSDAACSAASIDDANAPLRVFSVTLPYHGSMAENELALAEWARRYGEGADVVRYFTRKASDGLDRLVAQGYVDTSRVYAVGLSRGGLLAGHLALRNPLVSAVLGFSPVTVLTELAEFKGALNQAADGGPGSMDKVDVTRRLLDEASLLSDSCVAGLSRCAVRVYSGNADTRVGTRNCFDLMARLAERARANRVRSPPHEYIMYCSLGRDGHGTSSDVFAVGARWILRRAQLRT